MADKFGVAAAISSVSALLCPLIILRFTKGVLPYKLPYKTKESITRICADFYISRENDGEKCRDNFKANKKPKQYF